ncbi:MAG: SMP-30/gluconolactonase/LRE family protein, partial [Candidatus Binatia bacterium]
MEELTSGYGLVEAPRVDASDNLYFSDVLGGGVYRRSPDGTIDTVVPKRRGVGGLLLHADGGVVVSGRNVAHVRNGETRVLLEVNGVLGFNDMTSDAEGRVYAGSLRSSAFE